MICCIIAGYALDEAMRIRIANETDLEMAAQLWFERMALLQETDMNSRLAVDAMQAWRIQARHWIGADDYAFFVAEIRAELIGLLVVTIKDNFPWLIPPRLGEVVSMVLDLHRPQPGLGDALLQRAHEWVREQGLSLLEVETSANYPVEEAFWRARGGRLRTHRFRLHL